MRWLMIALLMFWGCHPRPNLPASYPHTDTCAAVVAAGGANVFNFEGEIIDTFPAGTHTEATAVANGWTIIRENGMTAAVAAGLIVDSACYARLPAIPVSPPEVHPSLLTPVR